jgi:hypothetical protein
MNFRGKKSSKKQLTWNADTYILMSAIHKGQVA